MAYLSWDPTPTNIDPPFGLGLGTQIEIETPDGPQHLVVTEVDNAACIAYLTEVEEPPHPGHCGCMGGSE